MNNTPNNHSEFAKEIFPSVNAAIKTIVDKQDARLYDDLIQSTSLKCLEKLDKYDPSKGSFFSWVYSVARFHFIDEMRKNEIRRIVDHREDMTFFHGVSDASRSEMKPVNLHSLIHSLPEKPRKVTILKYKFGCSAREISHFTGIPESQVAHYFSIAKTLIRNKILS